MKIEQLITLKRDLHLFTNELEKPNEIGFKEEEETPKDKSELERSIETIQQIISEKIDEQLKGTI
jgi:hypothetical protein